jgi:hypothetical protein
MQPDTTLTIRHFEEIDGLHSQLIRMGDFMDCADPRVWIAVSNRLLDACVDAGMAYDHDDHVGWAAERVLKTLCAA